ncbi:MAG: hypothetical protein IJ105_04095 [Bacilli bacterium]|nr:hypothetical protein [Bacilli bacterium]
MEEFDELFFKDYCDESLVEFIADQSIILKNKDNEYSRLLNERKNITENNDNIRKFIESDEIVDLTKEDLQQLYNFLELTTDIEEELEKEIFYIGMREAFYLFKKLDMLK